MDVERAADGHWQFRLGPIERWVVGIGAATLISMLAWSANSFSQRLDRLEQLLGTSTTQQAVANVQMSTLSAQLADVPALTRQMAEVNVQIKRNTADIDELRSLRKLK